MSKVSVKVVLNTRIMAQITSISPVRTYVNDETGFVSNYRVVYADGKGITVWPSDFFQFGGFKAAIIDAKHGFDVASSALIGGQIEFIEDGDARQITSLSLNEDAIEYLLGK